MARLAGASHVETPLQSSALESARVWGLHLLCFVLPVSTALFLWTAPHPWYLALHWSLVVIASVLLDMRSPSARRQPAALMPGWPFDSVLYILAALQLVNVALMVHMVAAHGFWRMDTLIAIQLVGINSGYSGIVVAHELVHRAQWHLQQIGRVVLGTVLYEHFYTEHVRGHHSRVATPEDPATAAYGESAVGFLLRTVPAQLRSAWRIETKRLGDVDMPWWDARLLRSRVVHGLAAEWTVALLILAIAGPSAFVVFLLQAMIAVRLLEAVNYFEHYGLMRSSRRVQAVDSWDTDSAFTLYTLVGLSRHADHHAYAARPYQQLRYFEESPKLPYGYFGTVVFLITRNKRFRAVMDQELRRRQLGPYAPAAE